MILKQNKYILLFCALLFCMLTVTNLKAQDTERILSFHSDIKIEQLERALITETIRINVTGDSVKEGIDRTIPKYTETQKDKKTPLLIKPISVTRDEQEEAFSVSENENFVDIHIGDESYALAPAIYEYCIVYEVSNNIYPYADNNIIDWEITGKNWIFPIDSVSATLHIPEGYKILNNWCSTNLNNIADDCDFNVEGDNIVYFECTTELDKGDAFAISTEFGLADIQEDASISAVIFSFFKKWDQLFLNLPFALFVGFTISLYQYKRSIEKRSPKVPQVTSSRDSPPQGRSAAELRYLYKGNLDSRAFASSLLSLARQGAITITQSEDGLINLTQKDTSVALASEERVLVDNLFIENNHTVTVGNGANSHFKRLNELWKKNISEKLNIRDYYLDKKLIVNKVKNVSAVVMVIWTFILFAFTDFQSSDFGKSMFALLLSGIFIIISNSKLKKSVSSKKIFKTICCIFTIIVFGILLCIIIFIILRPLSLANVWSFLFYSSVIILNIRFNDKYTARTAEGAEQIAKIENFRMYLKTSKDEQPYSAQHTIEQYDRMFPYAVALDLEEEWTQKFSDLFNDGNYQPAWYDGKVYNSIFDFASFFVPSFISSLFFSGVTFVIQRNSFPKESRHQ